MIDFLNEGQIFELLRIIEKFRTRVTTKASKLTIHRSNTERAAIIRIHSQ